MLTTEPVADLASSPIVTGLEDTSQWRAYLERRQSGTLYHRLEWDQVFDIYGLKIVRLVARYGDRVVGVLPFVHQRSFIFGSRLTSLPWFDTAGVLSEDERARDALVAQAVELSARARAKGLLLRQFEQVDGWPEDRTDKVLMRLPLVRNPDDLWKGFSPKVRNQVRKGEKAGLVAERVGADALKHFYAIYSRNMRDLGSPSHSCAFFAKILDAFGTDAQIHVVRLEREVVGAGLTLNNGRYVEIPWASSLKRYNSLCVNHVMYWHLLRHACATGFDWFHFGRSSVDSGTYHFKKQWGAEPKPLHWYQFSPDGTPPSSTKAIQEGYGWATKIWRRLPLWLTRLLGFRMVARLP